MELAIPGGKMLVHKQACSMDQLSSSAVPSNISSPGRPPPDSWVSTNLIPAVVLSFCFLLGVPGNMAVIALRPNWQHLSGLSQTLMVNLAISDLLCLLPLPLWIYTLLYDWTLGLVTCKLLAYLVYCSLYGSLLTVTALGVQRYLRVVQLQKWFDREGRKRMLALLWLIAMSLSIPSLVLRQLTQDQRRTICQPLFSSPAQQMAVLLSESLPGFVSITLVVFSYINLHREVNQAAFFNNPHTTRLLTSIIVTSFALWMPYHITNMLSVAAISLKKDGLLMFCLDCSRIVGALVFVNSFLNPLLYAFSSRNTCTACLKRNTATVVDAEAHIPRVES